MQPRDFLSQVSNAAMIPPKSDENFQPWRPGSIDDRRHYRSLGGDLDVEVCIVGGGLAGLTAACELAQRGWSVALLEANRIAGDALSIQLGIVAVGFSQSIERIIARVGIHHAKELWKLSDAGAEYVRRTSKELGLENTHAGQLVVQKGGERDVRRHADLLSESLGTAVELWPVERLAAVLRGPDYSRALHLPKAFQLDVRSYALGLAARAEAAGAKIFESTAAVAIDCQGIRKHVQTAAGRVRATHLVLTMGGDGGQLHPRLAGTTLRFARHMALTERCGDKLSQAIRFSGAVVDRNHCGVRHRVSGDRLLWASPLNTAAETRWLIAGLRRDIERHYPQLRDVEVAHACISTSAYALHRMPQIGRMAPGVWVAQAFGDHGINTAAMAGDLIARSIAECDDRWRLFAPYGLIWAGGSVGRSLAGIALKALRAGSWVTDVLRPRRGVPAGELPAVAPELQPLEHPSTALDLVIEAPHPPPAERKIGRKKRTNVQKRFPRPIAPEIRVSNGHGAPLAPAALTSPRSQGRRRRQVKDVPIVVPNRPELPQQVQTVVAPGAISVPPLAASAPPPTSVPSGSPAAP